MPMTREIRVPRIVGAFAAGRLMNTRTAHSQLMGGMIWGISSALHEATEIDAATRALRQRQSRRLQRAGECRYPASRGHSGARGGSRCEPGRRQRVWANSPMSAPPPRSPTRSITPPANEFANCRSASKACSRFEILPMNNRPRFRRGRLQSAGLNPAHQYQDQKNHDHEA